MPADRWRTSYSNEYNLWLLDLLAVEVGIKLVEVTMVVVLIVLVRSDVVIIVVSGI